MAGFYFYIENPVLWARILYFSVGLKCPFLLYCFSGSALKKKKDFSARYRKILFFDGAGERTRTADLLITNQLLYQLSYAGFTLIV